jgi:hypothetical protein
MSKGGSRRVALEYELEGTPVDRVELRPWP